MPTAEVRAVASGAAFLAVPAGGVTSPIPDVRHGGISSAYLDGLSVSTPLGFTTLEPKAQKHEWRSVLAHVVGRRFGEDVGQAEDALRRFDISSYKEILGTKPKKRGAGGTTPVVARDIFELARDDSGFRLSDEEARDLALRWALYHVGPHSLDFKSEFSNLTGKYSAGSSWMSEIVESVAGVRVVDDRKFTPMERMVSRVVHQLEQGFDYLNILSLLVHQGAFWEGSCEEWYQSAQLGEAKLKVDDSSLRYHIEHFGEGVDGAIKETLDGAKWRAYHALRERRLTVFSMVMDTIGDGFLFFNDFNRFVYAAMAAEACRDEKYFLRMGLSNDIEYKMTNRIPLFRDDNLPPDSSLDALGIRNARPVLFGYAAQVTGALAAFRQKSRV